MIFNTNFLKGFDTAPNGRKLLMSLAITYFQERLKADKNIVYGKVDTIMLYGKSLFYGLDKLTIEVNSDKKFKYDKNTAPGEFLLEAEVDNDKDRQEKLKKKLDKNK